MAGIGGEVILFIFMIAAVSCRYMPAMYYFALVSAYSSLFCLSLILFTNKNTNKLTLLGKPNIFKKKDIDKKTLLFTYTY